MIFAQGLAEIADRSPPARFGAFSRISMEVLMLQRSGSNISRTFSSLNSTSFNATSTDVVSASSKPTVFASFSYMLMTF